MHHVQELQSIRTKFEKTLLETQLEIQEQTFTQISQEIHDNIGQVLSLVRLNINRLDISHKEKELEETDKLLQQAITDLRQLSHNLNSDYIKREGLVKALEQLIANLERTGRFSTIFQSKIDVLPLSDDASIILYRIIQETINNIIRHAEARKVSLFISQQNNLVQITITDDGQGFDVNTIRNGIGLKNILNRAQVIGAAVDINSNIGEGTTITINCKNNLLS